MRSIHAIPYNSKIEYYEYAKDVVQASRIIARSFMGVAGVNLPFAMILEFYVLHCEGRKIAVSAASVLAGAAPTTGLRHIEIFIERGILEREADPTDRRRYWLQMTSIGLQAVEGAIATLASASSRGVPGDMAESA